MIEILLLVLILSLLVVLIFLVLKSKRFKTEDIQTAVSSSWINLRLSEKIGAIESHAKEIKESYKSFEQMLRVPTDRAWFGELALETILADQLPPEMYGIRERILDGKIPDAYIKSSEGLICVDAKFPLDNYAKMVGTTSESEKKSYGKDFLNDVSRHLSKIMDDYICPDKGSAPFAFAYIPSEAVFYYLLTETHEMLRKYAIQGVQVASPLTLSQKIELIRAGVYARKLSESAERVKNELTRLSRRFEEIDKVWQIFYRTHLKNLESKAEELDTAYQKLKDDFDKLEKL